HARAEGSEFVVERVEDPTRLPTYREVQGPKSKVQSPETAVEPLGAETQSASRITHHASPESPLSCIEHPSSSVADPAVSAAVRAVIDRLQLELKVIEKTGFLSYFLIVGDFVRYGHQQGIACVARGSAAGSI